MARSRNLKPGFFKNADLAALGERAQLLFAGLWGLADREGRLKDDPRWLRVEVLPYAPIDDKAVDGLLDGLASGPDPFIQRYEVDGRRYLQIVNWHAHQAPHHTERESRIPEPPKVEPLTNGSLTTKVLDAHIEVRGNKEEVTSKEGGAGETKPTAKFKPPTVAQVAAYCTERKNHVDAQNFVDFYTSKGWKVGREPMRDWKAAIRTWEKNVRNRAPPSDKPRTKSGFEIVPME